MDKEWMSKSRLSMEYENGVEYFLNFAIENGKDPNSMSCPCVKCGNLRDADLKTIRAHLTYNGIDLTYRCWILHGDRYRSDDTTNIEEGSTLDRDEPVDMEHDVCVDNPNHFHKILEEGDMPLYSGCDQFTKFSATFKLYNLKAKYGWSDTSFTDLLVMIRKMLPEDNLLPSSMYEARKSLSTLGMKYEKIHACSKDCILYRNEHANLVNCPTCGRSRWKSSLYSKHIVPYESMPEMLYNPPPQSGILREDWSHFVISRMSEGARKKSKELKERRGKNLYPHHISRKGYARLREEMKDQLTGDIEMDRAVLWKQARTNKQGEYDGEKLRQTVLRIDNFLRQKEEGVFCKSSPSDDILTQALETPEHSGRVRGIGGQVTPTVYFNLSKGAGIGTGNVVQKMRVEFGKQMADFKAEMDAKLLELHQMLKKDTEEKGSCSVKNQVDNYVNDVEEISPDCNVFAKVQQNKTRKQVSPTQHAKLTNVDIPKPLKMLHTYSRHVLTGGQSIKIPVDANVFGDEQMVYIFFDDIHNMCELEAIAASCICVYIWHLYKDCESTNLLDKFRFVNPYKVSHNSKVDPSERATIVGKRLIGTSIDQLVLLPCNVGWHWILLVVDPNKEIVYVLDPLSHEAHVEEWKKIMETAMKMFNMSIGKRGRQSVLWNMVKCQQQPDDKQCGFYVMRYMKDIIESSHPVSIPILFSEGFYSKREIDEVRKGWAEFVDDFTS